MKVWEVMKQPTVVVSPHTRITEVKALMKKTGARCAPAVIEDDKLVGFVVRRDVIRITSLKSEAKVEDFIRRHPILFKEMDLQTAFNVMIEHNVKAAPVADSVENPKLVGVLSLMDILRSLLTAGYKPKARTVGEVITKEYCSCKPSERIDRVWHKLVDEGVDAVLVERNGRIVGIITPKDLIDQRSWLFHLESERGIRSPGKVKSFMTKGVIVAHAGVPIEMVAEFLLDHDFNLLPVVDADGRVLGVIRQEDVVYAYLQGAKPVVEVAPAIAPPTPIEVEYVTPSDRLKQVLVEKAVEVRPPLLTARDVASKTIYAVTSSDDITRAINIMLRHKVSHLLVLNEKGNVEGALSKRCIVKALGLKGPIWRRRAYEPRFIEQIMMRSVPVVSANASLEEVVSTMLFHDIDCALVEGDGAKYMVTKDDLVEAYAKYYAGRALVENLIYPHKVGIVPRHCSLAHVVKLMESHYLDAVVVAEGDSVEGVISESKLVFTPVKDRLERRRRITWVRKIERAGRKIARFVKVTPLVAEDMMVPVNVKVKATADAAEAAKLMLEHGVDGLPVYDNGKLVGVITKLDFVRELARGAIAALEEREKKLIERARKGG
ncbi:MAG: CBS domain-containing protein [Candidatus Methanomethylicota archaeon]|uniref:CBS domain-containing protein n=1 Tax=Thermoproteota archaeon TaxID=2056631 RepID=A0A497EUZ9_9CREN|nr:MAG: CBS domain-containing protein [Candidatus Verstraetearchaeota archaeon]